MGTHSQDRRALSRAWRRFFYILLIACVLAYSLNLLFSEASPGQLLGHGLWHRGHGISGWDRPLGPAQAYHENRFQTSLGKRPPVALFSYLRRCDFSAPGIDAQWF